MTDQSLLATRFVERDFNIGHVFNQTVSIFSRNLLPFGMVCAVASLPSVLTFSRSTDPAFLVNAGGGWIALGVISTLVLNVLSQAAVLYAAFDFYAAERAFLEREQLYGKARADKYAERMPST